MSRAVVARLTIDGVQGVIAGFRKAGEGAQEYARVASKAGDQASAWIDKHERGLGKVSGGLLAFGAAGALALGGMVKSAIDWESAWAGVLKTVDGTPEQLSKIERGLRDMTKVKPTTHEDLAAIAEAAGQLGVETDSILTFTATMADLAETTNLGAEEAASSLAQLMNIMGTSQSQVGRLGSTIVALGNNSATTERDIVAMGQRLAGVGTQMGLTEADVLAMAAAMASVGIEAEAGGSAMSASMKKIDAAVREGGAKLETLAQVSGMTSEQFSAAWRDDAAGAIATFTEGLGGMIASGEDANGVLGELGISGLRESDTMIRLAGATKAAGTEQDLLRESLQLAAVAWEENTALANEAAQRYETRASQIQMAINGIKDEAITLGASLLPVVDGALRMVTGLTEAFAGLPGPVKEGATSIGLVATAAALGAGGLIKLVIGANNAKAAITGLGISMRTASLAMGAIGVAIAAAGLILSSWMGEQAAAKARVDALTDAIKSQGEVIGESSRALAVNYLQESGVLDTAREYGVNLADVTDAALGSAAAMDRVREAARGSASAIEAKIAANQAEMDSLSAMAPMTEEQMVRYTELSNANDVLNSQLSDRVSGEAAVTEAISKHADETQKAADKALQFSEAMGEGAEATDTAADASLNDAAAKQAQAEAVALTVDEMRALLESTQAYGNALLKLSGTQIGVESSIASLNERLAELKKGGEDNAATLDLTTEAGRKNQRALDDLASSTMNYVAAMYEQGASTQEIAAATERGRQAWIAGAVAMGHSTERATELAEAYFAIPERVETTIATPGALNSQREAEELNAKLRGLPDEVKSEIISIFDRSGADAAERALNQAARDRTARINVKVVGGQSAPVMGRTVWSAHGNLLEAYGSGGLRESHVAQIAPAGAWRVWAEPETGGEAYIPLANDGRRGRAEEIWREVGRRFGLMQRFAYGGMTGGLVSTTTHNAGGGGRTAPALPAGPVTARLAREDIDLLARTVVSMAQGVSHRTVDSALMALGRGV